MTKEELLELIHDSNSNVFKTNKDELIPIFQNLLSSLSTNENQVENLMVALYEYTVAISEISCTAMAKTLIDLDVLHISSTSD